MLNQLSFMVGEWKIACQVRDTKDAEWHQSEASASTKYILNNTALLEDFAEGEFLGLNLFTYNAASQEFQTLWIDTMSQAMYPMPGKKEGEKIVFSGKMPMQGQEKMLRQTFSNTTPTSYDFVMEVSDDGGNTWWEMMKFHHTRK